jgi:CRISPR-associated protein Csx17
MTMHMHILKGCSPAPLANYLKALGILRLVGEQADAQARGWWDGERFCLLTKLSKEELEAFFLEKYEPTPIFNPWGGRSGYYPGSEESTARLALVAIENSSVSRLQVFRDVIAIVRTVVHQTGGAKPKPADQHLMLRPLHLRLRGAALDWLNTVVADFDDRYSKPAVFGSGGNEGSGGYTAAYLAAVVETILNHSWDSHIGAALWNDGVNQDAWNGSFYPSPKGKKKGKKSNVEGPFRQFLPEGQGSPWELLLTFEGALIVQSGVARRSEAGRHRFTSSPFYFAPTSLGHGSMSPRDEVEVQQGRPSEGRGEQWFPLWGTPSTYAEIQLLFREGRCSSGRRAAKNPLDAARAICGLGTSRGITTFLRYGYLQRDNLATHFAVPLGRIQVRENSTARLVDDLSGWLDRLHRAARNKNAPARLVHAERRLADAVFAALTHDHTPDRWQAILLAAADIESLQATGTGIEAGVLSGLRPEWVEAVNDGTPEFRLALALGSAAASYFKDRPSDSIRHHLLPLEPGARRFQIADKKLVNDPRVVATGRDPLGDLAAIVERRLIEAAQKGQRQLRLVAAAGCCARFDDLTQFLSGAVDLDRLFGLARAFMALDWKKWDKCHAQTLRQPQDGNMPEECWLAVRLCCLPFAIDENHDIPADERIVRMLISGDAVRAIEIARQRLRSVGIRPPMYAGTTDSETARRWAAALAFPIHRGTAQRAMKRLDPSKKGLFHA